MGLFWILYWWNLQAGRATARHPAHVSRHQQLQLWQSQSDAAWKRRCGYGCKAACRCVVTVGRLKQCTGCCCEFSTVTLGRKSPFHSFVPTLLFTQSLTLCGRLCCAAFQTHRWASCVSIYLLSGEGLIRRPRQVSHPPRQALCPQTHCSTSPSCDSAQKLQPHPQASQTACPV